MNDPVIVGTSGVSVRYMLASERPRTIQEHLLSRVSGRGANAREFWALQGVTFSVGRGRSLGIIGPNGSGKSTLLKVIAGIIKPTEGEVFVRGKIAPMIELGAGFDPELTGRENIYLQGSILGLSRRQIDARYQRIVEYSGIGDFLHSPLKSYSSGMVSRLAFSVAVEVEAEILLVDEILSVGDEEFRRKCQHRINDFMSEGGTLLYVSHSMSEVQKLCDSVLWLEHGRTVSFGDADMVSRKYILHVDSSPFEDIGEGHPYREYVHALFVHGITSGHSVNGKRFYMPDNLISRAEFAAFLSKALAKEKTFVFRPVFEDVAETHWAARNISWLYEQGFIDVRRDGKGRPLFAPDEYVTTRELYDALSKIDADKSRRFIRDDVSLNRGEMARIMYEFFDYAEDVT